MNQIIMSAKREFWEHRSFVVGLPAVLAIVALLTAFTVEYLLNEFGSGALSEVDMQNDGDPYEAMAWYVSVGWLAGFYYLLGSLFNDRKDKSILFFKSLPISEHFNVLTKLAFGSVGTVAIAIVIGWVGSFALMILGLGNTDNQGLSFANLYAYTLAPVQVAIVGAIWAAPIFAYLAFASAAARKSPFLLTVVPLVLLSWIEGLFFKNVEILSFFFSHQPFAVLEYLEASSGGSVFTEFFITRGQSMLIGLVVAAIFAAAAVWYRNNKFEI